MLEGGQQRLARRAQLLKKAWLMSAAWIGAPLRPVELSIPDYASWPRRRLASQVRDLEDDLFDALKRILLKPQRSQLNDLAVWLSETFDSCQKAKGPVSLCTAQEFETRWGLLRARLHIEVPPYAEMLFQGWLGLAIRHPEYMLARDVAFLLSLFRQSEEFMKHVDWRKPPQWSRKASENSQALARTVIQACFNLLESFVSGIARAHLMTATLSADEKHKLFDNRTSLKKRLISFPKMIAGPEAILHDDRLPMSRLFGPIKRRRDAFVHCEPGPQSSSHGYVKEAAFHDVGPEIVEEAVADTSLIIKTVWKSIHKVDGPRWLPDFSNRSEGLAELQLAPPADLKDKADQLV
jgi:hypothetical protein